MILVGLFTNQLLGNDDSFPMQDGAEQVGADLSPS